MTVDASGRKPASSAAEGGGGIDSARELREKKRVLAALVVHDLRSPLTALEGVIHLLRDEVGANGQSLLDDAGTLVQKVLGLVSTILDVDELEDGILRAHLTSVRIGELVERARSGNRASFEMRQVGLEVSVPDDMIVRMDRDLMARVVENLLDNATRYAPRGGRVSVIAVRDADGLDGRSLRPAVSAAEGQRGWIELAVGNSGPPVPPDERDKIFGRYHQVDARRAAARQNRGLGLYFCKLAVEAHGGTIHVEERAPLGAVFVVRLPE